MPSKLYHTTRRRKNALKNLSVTNSDYILRLNKHSKISPEFLERNTRIRKEEAEILRHRIASGAHSSAWYKKSSRKKPIVTETEAA